MKVLIVSTTLPPGFPVELESCSKTTKGTAAWSDVVPSASMLAKLSFPPFALAIAALVTAVVMTPVLVVWVRTTGAVAVDRSMESSSELSCSSMVVIDLMTSERVSCVLLVVDDVVEVTVDDEDVDVIDVVLVLVLVDVVVVDVVLLVVEVELRVVLEVDVLDVVVFVDVAVSDVLVDVSVELEVVVDDNVIELAVVDVHN